MSSGLSKEQLIALVNKIVEAQGTEEAVDSWIEQLKANVPHPSVTDLIYYSDPPLTPEEVIEKALSYEPIKL
jgi:hypothetical protein